MLCGQSHYRKFPMLTLVVVVGRLVWVFGSGVVLLVGWFEFVCCKWRFVLGVMELVGDVVLLLYFDWFAD